MDYVITTARVPWEAGGRARTADRAVEQQRMAAGESFIKEAAMRW